MNVKQFIRVSVTITAVLLTASYAVAQGRGGGGGGGPGQNGGGVIYFRYNFELYTMNDDGSGVELATGFPISAHGEPSRELHADKRWIAQGQSVPGEYYPDGDSRREFVALSDAGDIVPLHIEADLEPIGDSRWGVGDGFLSWVARRWDVDPESPTYGQVVDGGLYVTPLEFDIDGNIAGIGAPSSLLVSRDLVDGLPDIRSHDWSPDGSAIVFGTRTGPLVIFDLLTQTFDLVELSGGSGGSPRWSPAGDKLMLYYSDGNWGGVVIMNIDGSGLKKLEKYTPGSVPIVGVWSPTGSHLVYSHRDYAWRDSYIVRAKSDGKGRTRITDRSMGDGYGIFAKGWRE